jgi:hypothetical protein
MYLRKPALTDVMLGNNTHAGVKGQNCEVFLAGPVVNGPVVLRHPKRAINLDGLAGQGLRIVALADFTKHRNVNGSGVQP